MRRVLFDENMPRKLRREMPELNVRTVQEEGWAGLQNGDLLRRASSAFDVLVTADQRMRYQQNIPRFDIGVVVIIAADTRLPHLRPIVAQLLDAIRNVKSGSVWVVQTP